MLFMAALLLFWAGPLRAEDTAQNTQHWWKGNIHCHTFWSDGDDYPEMVAKWYKDNGYHFLAITDHNVFPQEGKWVDLSDNAARKKAFGRYQESLGPSWVKTRTVEGKEEIWLMPVSEYRSHFEEPGRFLFLTGEEITDHANGSPVHLNAIQLQSNIPPQGGSTVLEVMQRDVYALYSQLQSSGQLMLATLNHPNFFLARPEWLPNTAEDAAQVKGLKFYELYNGHPGVFNAGNETHVSTERWWDIVLTKRLTQNNGEILYCVATDDTHNYHDFNPGMANPGRGWITVAANELTADAIIQAMDAGNFYASTGVTLKSIQHNTNEMQVEVEPETDVEYTIRFIGTRKGFDPAGKPAVDADGKEIPGTMIYSETIGAVLAEIKGASAVYTMTGDEMYVRAKVISSKKQTNSVNPNDLQTAWCQPIKGPAQN
jgi:hypothetical protein